jgi:glutathione S-transferase
MITTPRWPPQRSVDTEARVLELLEAIAAGQQVIAGELRGLRADLARQRPGASLSRADRDRLARLLPAVAGAFGSEPYVVNELPDAVAVRVVLDELGLTAKQLGRLFHRGVGLPIGRLVVERAGVELHRTLWRVVGVVGV